MPTRTLSDLECFVIGVVWQLGPCSPYDIRRTLTDSPSTQWSGSAGSIYPLVRRLEGFGLLRSRAERRGKRARREYTVSPAGVRVLRKWVGPPLAASAISATYDPLRSRARFLAALPQSARDAWVKAALKSLDEVERRVKLWQERYGDRGAFAALLTRSGELDLRARRQWLRELADTPGMIR